MKIMVGFLVSLAAGIAFYWLQPFFIDLKGPWDWLVSLGLFAVCIALAFAFSRGDMAGGKDAGGGDAGPGFVSDNDVGGTLDVNVEDSTVRPVKNGKVVSDNRAQKDMTVNIKNSKI